MDIKEEHLEKLASAIEHLSSLNALLKLSMPDFANINALKASLPDIEEALKNVYVEIMGKNPWE